MRCPICHRRLAAACACPEHAVVMVASTPPAMAPPRGVDAIEGLVAIGAGGFAGVWAGRRAADGRPVAVKVAHAPGDERFPREAAALRRLGPPVTPELLTEGTLPDGRPYLVMELLSGRFLGDWMAARPERGGAPAAEVARVFGALCAAIQRVHDAGVVHRDLKPEHLVLGGDQARVVDFGLARIGDAADDAPPADARLTRTGARLGTVTYMAPEQCLEARAVDRRADVYSLGVILYELLTGRPPFVGEPAAILQAHASRRPTDPSALVPLPPEVDEVVLRGLAKDPAARYPEVAAFGEAFARAIARPEAGPRAAIAAGAASAAGRRPIALLALRGPNDLAEARAAAATEGGVLARCRGGCVLFAFPQLEPGAGTRAARRAAGRLGLPAGAAAIHVAEARVREGPVPLLAGAALERPEDWWPEDSVAPAAATAAAAAWLAGADEGGVAEALPPLAEPALRGRDADIDALLALARAAFAARRPALATVLGEVGVGKTRLLAAIGAALRADPAVRVVALAAPPGEAGRPEWLIRALLRLGLALGDEPVDATAIRAACVERLGEAHGGSAWAAVSVILGALAESDPAAAPVLGSPGALRQAGARAAGEALRGLAAGGPLALLVDDGQLADHAGLDALEVATLAGHAAPLFVAVAARAGFAELRPAFADRAARAVGRVLAPLSAADARAVLLELLHPVEFVPEPVQARLCDLAQGLPLHLVEMAHALRSGGAVRRHRAAGGWYLAADELLHLSTQPLGERLAGQLVSSLAPDLAAFAGLCAVLGDELDAAELDAVQRLLAGRAPGAAACSLDAGVGLARLARAGVLHPPRAGRTGFRHAMLREAIERLVPPAQRTRYHAAALAYLEGRGAATAVRRIARHAAACGAAAAAFRARLELAEEACRRHRPAEADEHFTAALALEPAAEPAARRRLLAGRGRIRYRMERYGDALDDLRAARRLAEEAGDEPAVADLLLEEATVYDWWWNFPASASAVEQAVALVARAGDPALEARCLMAVGRSRFRAQRFDEAIDALARAAASPQADRETRLIACTVLGSALTFSGRLDDAEARYGEAIRLCEEAGDWHHLGIACNNRINLWTERGLHDRAVEDARRGSALARVVGNPMLERGASWNLAELLYFRGELTEAAPLARRALELLERSYEHPGPDDALLLARILLASDDTAGARAQLAWIAAHCAPDATSPWLAMLRHVVERLVAEADRPPADRAAARAEWHALVAEARAAAQVRHEVVEVLTFAARAAARRGDREAAAGWLADARREAGEGSIWEARFGALAAALEV